MNKGSILDGITSRPSSERLLPNTRLSGSEQEWEVRQEICKSLTDSVERYDLERIV